jgi:hypothetical protein
MHAACSSCSPLLERTRGPAHDTPLPPLLAVHAPSHRAARFTPRPPRPLLLAVPLCACCPCTPSRRATRCCVGPSPSRPLALAACALSPSIPAAINGEVPVLLVTLPSYRSPPPSYSASRKKKGRPVHNPLHFFFLCSPQPSTSLSQIFNQSSFNLFISLQIGPHPFKLLPK